MHRFFISSHSIVGQTAIITDATQVHHMRDVLRLGEGKVVMLCDEKGNEYTAVIKKIAAGALHLTVKEKRAVSISKHCKFSVACAIPKNVKMDDIVDKLTQLGVDAIIPTITERVIVRLHAQKAQERVLRWRKIAEKAAQQSQRATITHIEAVRDLKSVIKDAAGFDIKLIPTLAGQRIHLREAIGELTRRSIFVLIGPEGDFTDEEVKLAIEAEFVPVTLGDLVLRVDTAAIAVASYIRLTIGV